MTSIKRGWVTSQNKSKLLFDKVVIFFQYLFDALISFRAKEYEDDLRSLPAPDDMNPSDAEIEAIARLRDLHHYYTPKVDLTALLKSLYKGP